MGVNYTEIATSPECGIRHAQNECGSKYTSLAYLLASLAKCMAMTLY